jgi:hypothetical protein
MKCCDFSLLLVLIIEFRFCDLLNSPRMAAFSILFAKANHWSLLNRLGPD